MITRENQKKKGKRRRNARFCKEWKKLFISSHFHFPKFQSSDIVIIQTTLYSIKIVHQMIRWIGRTKYSYSFPKDSNDSNGLTWIDITVINAFIIFLFCISCLNLTSGLDTGESEFKFNFSQFWLVKNGFCFICVFYFRTRKKSSILLFLVVKKYVHVQTV